MSGTAVRAANVTVAENLRLLREAGRISLGTLAARSGISKGTLSKIEAGDANPTLDTLETLSATLGVPLGDLVSPRASASIEVVRKDEGVDLGDAETPGRIVKVLTTPRLSVEVHDLTIPAGHYEISATHGEGSWEHVLVRQGRVEVGPMDQTATLSAGDYALYPADRPHVWRGNGSTDARVWVVLTAARQDAP